MQPCSLEQPLSFMKDSPDLLTAAQTFFSVTSVPIALDCTGPRGSGWRVKGTRWRTALFSYKGNPLFTALPTVSFGSPALRFVPGTVPLKANEGGRRWGLGTGGDGQSQEKRERVVKGQHNRCKGRTAFFIILFFFYVFSKPLLASKLSMQWVCSDVEELQIT